MKRDQGCGWHGVCGIFLDDGLCLASGITISHWYPDQGGILAAIQAKLHLEVGKDPGELQHESAYLGVVKKLLCHDLFFRGLTRLCARSGIGIFEATVVAVVGPGP